MKLLCDYCGSAAKVEWGRTVYPHRPDLSRLMFYVCRPCGAWVGVHKGTRTPLGRLANAELRRAKQAAHAAFDPVWKSGRVKRGSAYKRLAAALGVKEAECHIGMFDIETCRRVVEVSPTLMVKE